MTVLDFVVEFVGALLLMSFVLVVFLVFALCLHLVLEWFGWLAHRLAPRTPRRPRPPSSPSR